MYVKAHLRASAEQVEWRVDDTVVAEVAPEGGDTNGGKRREGAHFPLCLIGGRQRHTSSVAKLGPNWGALLYLPNGGAHSAKVTFVGKRDFLR